MAQRPLSQQQDTSQQPSEQPCTTQLNEADQKRVDEFTSSGVNSTERPRFRPWIMMLWLSASIVALGLVAQVIGLFFAH